MCGQAWCRSVDHADVLFPVEIVLTHLGIGGNKLLERPHGFEGAHSEAALSWVFDIYNGAGACEYVLQLRLIEGHELKLIGACSAHGRLGEAIGVIDPRSLQVQVPVGPYFRRQMPPQPIDHRITIRMRRADEAQVVVEIKSWNALKAFHKEQRTQTHAELA